MFVAGWHRVLMIHFEIDAEALQRDVPFELDLFEGRAFVSLVAFAMRNMRPQVGGKLSAWLFRPIASHDFLNVRTYVRHNGESGIHFLAEWLSSWLAVRLGPMAFGLPYHHGRIRYHCDELTGTFVGRVVDVSEGSAFAYRARTVVGEGFQPCAAGSLTEWLMERYTAFNNAGGSHRYFRVWHPPWPQCPAEVTLDEISLLIHPWHWFRSAKLIGVNYSPGFSDVWMGRPHWC